MGEDTWKFVCFGTMNKTERETKPLHVCQVIHDAMKYCMLNFKIR